MTEQETMRLHISDMPKDLHMSLKMEALKQGTSLKVLVKKIFKEYLDAKK